jgi:hypothetical protein
MDYIKKSKEDLITELESTKQELERLKSVHTRHKDHVDDMEAKLAERLKELRCQNLISKLLSEPQESSEELIKKIVDIIPPAFQFPDICKASVTFRGKEYKTKGYKKLTIRE